MKNKRSLLFSLSILFILAYMLLWPEKTLEGSRSGLLLWFQTILPTLLPFLILSNLLIRTQILPRLLNPLKGFFSVCFGLSPCGGFALLTGLFCGYPMGAKITADLYRERKLSVGEAKYLLSIANNPSPVFLITYLLHDQIGIKENTMEYLLQFYGCLLAAALLLRISRRKEETSDLQESYPWHKKETSHPLPPGVLIDVSIMNSFETITKLGGYIILCSIGVTATELIPDALFPIRIFLCTVLEISTGIHHVAALPFSGRIRRILALSAAAFGGFCIFLQTYSVIRDSGLPISCYLKGKLVQTILTASILFLL